MKKRILFIIVPFIIILSSCSGDTKDWQSVKKQNTIQAYEQFIKEYPQSIYKDSADIKIKETLFIIEDFSASNACDGKGTVELQMEDGQLIATLSDDVDIIMRTNGLPSMWCHGLTHVWIGKGVLKKYTFDSNADDPLQFIVDKEIGYYYKQGSGSIITPEGEVIRLPATDPL